MRLRIDVYRPALAVLLLCGCCGAGAQTTPSGQVVAPGTQSRKTAGAPCSGTDTTTPVAGSTDANCVEAASPAFATPDLGTMGTERPRNVVALVRVDMAIPRPPVKMPEGDSFGVVGSATLVKVHRAELAECLATGKRISKRANASTSTTCLDRKGELMAYQECKAGSADCVVMTPQEIAKQQSGVAAQ